MNTIKTAVGLSLILTIASLIHACQPEEIPGQAYELGNTAQPVSGVKDDDAKVEDKKTDPTPAATPGATPPAPVANYTMTWDISADAAIVSYKIFIVPPDRNPRFPGKTDVPIQIKNYPIAGLTKNGQKYSVVVTGDEIKAALVATAAATYCFTIVAVNGVGNSSHSPVICP